MHHGTIEPYRSIVDVNVLRGWCPMVDAPTELLDLLQVTDPVARDAAWGRFTYRFSPLLLRTTRAVTWQYDHGMDAYAHVLEQLSDDGARRLRRYAEEPECRFTTWLAVVTRRLAIDYLRQRYGRTRCGPHGNAKTQVARRQLADLVANELGECRISDEAELPDERLCRRDLARALHASIGRLSPQDRLLLSLRFEEDLPAREIATILRLPTPYHVYRALHATLNRLRAELRVQGITEAQP